MQALHDPGGPSAAVTPEQPARLVLLSIAGCDPSAGAGFLADLKVFAAHHAYGVACPTAWTVQSTAGVRAVASAAPDLVTATLECLADDVALDGIKIGMLATEEVLRAVTAWLAGVRQARPRLPVVLDPVLASSSGRPLLSPGSLPTLRQQLLPLASVVTPNLQEAALLAEMPVVTRADAERAGEAILRQMSDASGGVVITGGHLDGGSGPDDLVYTAAGERHWIPGTWVETSSTHGTGCAYSSALLCSLAAGAQLTDAARAAKQYVEGALLAAYPVGQGRGPMHHLYSLERSGER